MSPKSRVTQIIDQMMETDAFSQWLGLERLAEASGTVVLRMKIRQEMCNGFGIAHGGITFSFADSALAFASNSHGRRAVSIETSISHTKPVQVGEWIQAEAVEESLTNKIGIYSVKLTNEKREVVALFKGTVYRTSKDWE